MKQLVICSLLVLILAVYVAVGARAGHAPRAQMRARRNTFVDDRLYERQGLIERSKKTSHLFHPKTKRFRREAENADFYKRGQTESDPEERLKRVKKFDQDTIV